jgi:hypothetical protein
MISDTRGALAFALGKDGWFYGNYEGSARRWSSSDPRRKQWSALIAKIPLALSRHIAATFR